MTIFVPSLPMDLLKNRWKCILDPNLALSEHGITLVKNLGEVMDLWLVREFWHILEDNTMYYEQLTLNSLNSGDISRNEELNFMREQRSQQVKSTLKAWKQLRLETDLGHLNLFWVNDSLSDSMLPRDTDAKIIWRWESLARNLESLGKTRFSEPLASAFRDAAALSAALGSAFILTHRSPEEVSRNLPPSICIALEEWGIICQEIEPANTLVTVEGNALRQLFVEAGVSKLLWAGLKIAILHLVVPKAINLNSSETSRENNGSRFTSSVDLDNSTHFWTGAQGFWYTL